MRDTQDPVVCQTGRLRLGIIGAADSTEVAVAMDALGAEYAEAWGSYEVNLEQRPDGWAIHTAQHVHHAPPVADPVTDITREVAGLLRAAGLTVAHPPGV